MVLHGVSSLLEAKGGNNRRTSKGFKKVMARLLTQRIPLEVVKARRGARSSQSATKAKIVIKKTIRIAISLGIFTMAVKLWSYGNLSLYSPKTEYLASSFQTPPYLSHLWHNVL